MKLVDVPAVATCVNPLNAPVPPGMAVVRSAIG
jgi:hypothetical protein